MPNKRTVDDLAFFGGRSALTEDLHVGRPNIGSRENLLKRINDILDRRWLTNNGVYVQEFEKRVAQRIGVKHCIAMCSGTTALEIAIRALEMQGEVIVPSMTFVATAHALQWQGIAPVFCDVDPQTYTLDPLQVESLVTSRTRGIIGVHLWSRPCDTGRLTAIAQKHRLPLLFDAAHAFGCSHQGRSIGNFGDAEVFSFHATKILTALEGGGIATNSDALAEKMRLMRNFGFAGYDDVIYVGTNGKMDEMSAAMGLTSLEQFEEFLSRNQQNYRQYRQALASVPGVRLLNFNEQEHCNYQYIVIEIEESKAGISRDLLKDILWAERILARRYFYPGCHRMEPYRTLFPEAGRRLPVTERLVERVLVLPTGAAVTAEHIQTVCDIIQFAVSHSKDIRQAKRIPAPSHS